MLAFVLQVLQRTPLWVWPLFLVLVAFGILQSRTRAVPKPRLFVLPAAMIALSLAGVWSTFGANPASLGAWLAGGGLAVLLNRFFKQPGKVVYSPQARTFTVPGSWLPLTLMMVIFLTRYAVTVTVTINPALLEATAFAAGVSLAYGVMSGTFLARALHTLRAER
jgi:hypothetical protein